MDEGESTEITSPNYPEDYGNFAHELWAVSAPSGYGLVAHFRNFSLENGFDYLTVYQTLSSLFQESTQVARLTGSDLPDNVTSLAPYMWFVFTSDGSVSYGGFRLTVGLLEMSGTLMSSDLLLFANCSGL